MNCVNYDEILEHVLSTGLCGIDTMRWWRKFQAHKLNAVARGIESKLTFTQYLSKVVEGGLKYPEEIGRRRDQHHLSRIGDVGPYTTNSCRFIPAPQNHREKVENGRRDYSDLGPRNRARYLGQTKETSISIRKSAEARLGRTKENYPYIRAVADKLAKSFILTDPHGVTHAGKNLKDFCRIHGLNFARMSCVCRGLEKHHKRWIGHYVEADIV